MKYIKWIFIVLTAVIFGYLLLGQSMLTMDVPEAGYRCEKFTGKWSQIKADGTKIPIDIPGKCEARRDEKVVIETTLPDEIGYDECLCFRSSKQDMSISVDGIVRQQYSTEDTRLFGKVSAVAYVFLDLRPEDAGKVLTLETQTDSSYSGIFYTVYAGNRMGIWNHFFSQYGTELVVAFLTMVLGIISIIGSIALRLCYHRKIELEYLGWGVMLAAVWLIANSLFRQLIFPNISVINDITFLVIMVLPLPFMIYMNGIQKQRYRKVYEGTSILVVADFVVCCFLHMTSCRDFTDTIVGMVTVCILAILVMGATMIIDIWKGYIREYVFVAVGILGALLAAVIQIFLYFQRTNLFTGVILALGLIFLLIFSVINTIREILSMEREKQQALLSNQSKGRFLANMSHEIRTPINAVLGMDAMILRESTETRIREYALDIQNAGQNLLALINDILDFSKIESGKMELRPVEYDFSSLIHDIMNMITMKAEAKELTMDLYVDENLPSRLWGDDVRIRQILVNLLNNAVKYTDEGGVSLHVSGVTDEKKVTLRFEVKDTGIGIREEDIGKLFAEFERIEEQRNRNIEGTGLGMSITVQLLELMDSQLQVESVYGEGSRFSFELEQKIMDADPIGNLEQRIRQQATAYSYQAAFTAPEAEILVVDDNAINRRVFASLLKETMVKIEEASSGSECLEMVSEKKYDLIFLDHMMPDMDGIETLHRIRGQQNTRNESVPIVAITANAITGARELYLSEGFDSYLSKPINPEKLENMLMEYLPEEKIIFEKTDIGKERKPVVEKTQEEFPEVDGMDWEYALLHTKDEEILKNTLENFYDMIETEAAKLEQFFEQTMQTGGMEETSEARKQYRVQVHSMKSSAAMVGAVSLSGIAKMLEYAARDGKPDVIGQITPVFLKEWRSMKESLSFCGKDTGGEENADKPEADCRMTVEYLRLLESAMEEMDVDTADEIAKQLKRFTYPDEMLPMIDEICAAVMNLDLEKVTGWSGKLVNKIREMED